MNILSSIGSLVSSNKDRNQDFTVTEISKWHDYTYLTREKNYYSHYVGWVWKAINTIADGIVDHDPILMDDSGKEPTEVERRNSVLLNDLYRFNGFQTYAEARKLTIAHKLLTGNAFWYIKKAENAPGHIYEFYVLNPQSVRIRPDRKTGLPVGYWYRQPSGEEIFLEEDDVIVFRTMNPQNWVVGNSAIDAMAFQQLIWEKMNSTILNLFGNEARMQGVLSIEGSTPELQTKIETELKRKYVGVHNAGKIMVSNRKAEWSPISATPRDLEYNQGLEQMREDILAMLGVPLELAMVVTGAKFKNAEEAQRLYQRQTLKPKLQEEVAVFNEQLIRKYFDGFQSVGFMNFKFVIDNPVMRDVVTDSQVAVQLYSGNIITKNEAREAAGYAKVEDGDKFANEIDEDLFNNRIQNIQQNNESKPDEEDEGDEQDGKKKSLVKDMWQEAGFKSREEAKTYFHKKSIENEYLLKDQVTKFFKKQGKRVVANTKKTKDVEVSWEKEVDEMVKHLLPTLETIGENANTQVEIFLDTKKPVSKKVLSKIKENVIIFSKEVTDTTRKKIEQVFIDAQTEGLGLAETKKRLSEVYAKWSNPIDSKRAETIARTETTRTTNLVAKERYLQDGIKYKEWLSAKDNDVRGSKPTDKYNHKEVDGERIKMNEKFDVSGNQMDRPGDSSADPGNVINCRCTLVPRLEKKQ